MSIDDEVLKFSNAIEDLVWEKDISYMEGIVLYCEKTGLEIEVTAKLISQPLKNKLREEAEALHFLPKSSTAELPI